MNWKVSAVICCLAILAQEFGNVASGMHGTRVNSWLLVVVMLAVETSELGAGERVLVLVLVLVAQAAGDRRGRKRPDWGHALLLVAARGGAQDDGGCAGAAFGLHVGYGCCCFWCGGGGLQLMFEEFSPVHAAYQLLDPPLPS